MMTRCELLAVLRRTKSMVEATTRADGQPQAAVAGIAATDELELVFDTSRNDANLVRDPRSAFVMFDDEVTVPSTGDELARVRDRDCATFPDGRDRARAVADITWLRVRPSWIRISDCSVVPPRIEELVG